MCKIVDFRNGGNYSNYYCRNYKTTTSKCSPHKIKTVDLDKMVLEAIIMQIKATLNIEKIVKKLKDTNNIKNKKEYEDKIIELKNDLEKIKKLKRISYENWKLKKITKEEFLLFLTDCDNKTTKINLDIKIYEQKLESSLKDIQEEEYWIEHFRRNKKVKALSREIIEELIDCIYVHEDGNITIKFKYQDEYNRVLNGINNEKEETI